ncbi:MAG: fatty acyl-AMP ligase [Sphingomonadales bacterium]|nr:fatty acyl-AMP ligase [Sphingomonadales bacterium]MDE2168022.1 fatty acyl-AMP ligase [Sphingomonadales bacterium]
MTDTAVLEHPTALVATPNADALPRRLANFGTFVEALDYAAKGVRGLNFHDPRGNLTRAYPFSELREDAVDVACRLIARGVKKGDRIAMVAETGAEFAALFCGAIYAGAWPVPLPLPTSFGGKDNYIDQLAVQLRSSDPVLFFYPPEILAMGDAATVAHNEANGATCQGLGWDVLYAEPVIDVALPEARGEDICYLQYSSGSTRFPHGVAVTHASLMNNLAGHGEAMRMDLHPLDRCVSWLPWYHDMGLVGCFLSIIANQVSTDYLRTEDFARRPLAWLDLVSRNEGTTVSYSPTFGYDICARRISSQTHVADRFDLSRWRLAGNGADMIRPDVMQSFVNAFAPAGFHANAFLPSYGLAEATLSVTIMPPGEGIRVELVEEERLSGQPRDLSRPARYRAIVNCGKPVKDMVVEIRDGAGKVLSDHQIGKVWCKGPSVMHSYFRDPESTDACLVDGWLDTGDMGYQNADGYLFIVGRAKDMIIINGKNHWPQDIEWAVEQLPGFHQGDIAAFSLETETGEETAAVLVHCRVSDPEERVKLKNAVAEKVRSILGHPAVVELVPPRTLPRTSSGKLSRAKAKKLYLSGEIEPFQLAA